MKVSGVVVTGLGIVSPAGIGVPANWERICDGKPTAALDPALAGHPVPISCRVPGFDPVELLGAKPARRLDPFVQFAIVACQEAIASAGLSPDDWDGGRVGVVLGSAEGGADTYEQQHQVLLRETPTRVSPHLLSRQLPNMVAGCVSLEFGATGPSMVVTTACASGATAIGLGRDLLMLDRCDIALCGGSEAMITPLVMAGFAQMGALSRRTGEPEAASRPFDVDRDGFVAGEGAAILVLERAGDARARRAHARARVMGFGASADAYHVTSPHPGGQGAGQALRAALADAGLDGREIGHVNAHATSTPQGDLAEARMLRRVLGDGPVVTSTKGVTGHMFGAAGAAEAAFTVLAIEHGLVPPTANLSRLDPDVALDVAVSPRARKHGFAVSTSLGFGGQNAALVIGAA
ncbi:MAG TPA: beta-ketoacyl-[acyl-carrier-protein] synthase family protein [Streptosporangiaceae bacterium]